MSIEDFKKIEASELSAGKLISIIDKNQTLYLNHQLEEFNINSSQLHFLFEISLQREINQEMISSRCNIDKGSVARSIRKLEENGLVTRKIDDANRRQNKISLTPEGKRILSKAKQKLDEWEDSLFENNSIERDELQKVLKEISIKAIDFNQNGGD